MSGYNQDGREAIRASVEFVGGRVSMEAMTRACTHLLLPVAKGAQPVPAQLLSLPAAGPGCCRNITDPAHPPCWAELGWPGDLLPTSPQPATAQPTILAPCRLSAGPKYDACERFGTVPVTADWLIDTIVAGRMQPEERYCPPLPAGGLAPAAPADSTRGSSGAAPAGMGPSQIGTTQLVAPTGAAPRSAQQEPQNGVGALLPPAELASEARPSQVPLQQRQQQGTGPGGRSTLRERMQRLTESQAALSAAASGWSADARGSTAGAAELLAPRRSNDENTAAQPAAAAAAAAAIPSVAAAAAAAAAAAVGEHGSAEKQRQRQQQQPGSQKQTSELDAALEAMDGGQQQQQQQQQQQRAHEEGDSGTAGLLESLFGSEGAGGGVPAPVDQDPAPSGTAAGPAATAQGAAAGAPAGAGGAGSRSGAGSGPAGGGSSSGGRQRRQSSGAGEGGKRCTRGSSRLRREEDEECAGAAAGGREAEAAAGPGAAAAGECSEAQEDLGLVVDQIGQLIARVAEPAHTAASQLDMPPPPPRGRAGKRGTAGQEGGGSSGGRSRSKRPATDNGGGGGRAVWRSGRGRMEEARVEMSQQVGYDAATLDVPVRLTRAGSDAAAKQRLLRMAQQGEGRKAAHDDVLADLML